MLEFILTFLMTTQTNVCRSTTFGQPGDKHGGTTNALGLGRPVNQTDLGIAHRTWPMWTMVKVTNTRTKKTAYGVVLDSGPYGMVDGAGWFSARAHGKMTERAKKRVAEVGQKAYRSCADLTYAFGIAVDHNGGDTIKLERLAWAK